MLLKNKLVQGAFVATLLTLPSALAAASDHLAAMQLKTSVEDVNGVRDIEAGDYQTGIRKTQAALNLLSVSSQRAPLLTNLCVAHIAEQSFADAKVACDASVEARPGDAIALNNRAVLHYLTGDFKASRDDLESAAEGIRYQNVIASNMQVLDQKDLVAKN